MGDSARNMQELAKGAKIVSGKRFGRNASVDELKNWVAGLRQEKDGTEMNILVLESSGNKKAIGRIRNNSDAAFSASD